MWQRRSVWLHASAQTTAATIAVDSGLRYQYGRVPPLITVAETQGHDRLEAAYDSCRAVFEQPC